MMAAQQPVSFPDQPLITVPRPPTAYVPTNNSNKDNAEDNDGDDKFEPEDSD